MADKKKLQELQNHLSYQTNKIDFVQAEQNMLFAKMQEFSEIGRVINGTGYGESGNQSFWMYEHPDPSSFIGQMRGTKWQDKMNFIKLGKLIGGELIPYVQMTRVHRDPRDKTKVVFTQNVPLNNYDQIAKLSDVAANKSADKSEQVFYYGNMRYDIESIDFELKNQNPFAASRMVDVNIKFVLDSILALDFEIGADATSPTNQNGFRLRDLLSFARGRPKTNQEYYGGYGLLLRLGYMPPLVDTYSKDPDYINEIVSLTNTVESYGNMALELELIDYDIDVKDNGKVTLTLNYISFIEDFSKKLSFDLFRGRILTPQQISEQVDASKTLTNMNEQLANLESATSALTHLIELEKRRVEVTADIVRETQQDVYGTTNEDEFDSDLNQNFYELQAKRLSGPISGPNGKRDQRLIDIIESKNDFHMQLNQTKQPYGGNYVQSLKNLNEQKSAITQARDAKLAEINERLVNQNKIAKYNLFLEYLFQDQKIYEAKIPTKDLVLFSKEYDNTIEAYVKEAIELDTATKGEGPSLDEQAVMNQTKQQLDQMKKDATSSVTMTVTKAEVAKTHKTVAESVKDTGKTAGETADEAEVSLPEQVNIQKIIASKIAGASSVIPITGKDVTVYYIYLGDFIDVALKYTGVKKMLDDSQMGVILGSVKIIDPLGSGKEHSINIGDIPVSLKYLIKWFKKNIVEPDIDKYDVTKFLQDVATQLVSPILASVSNRYNKSSRDIPQIKNTTFNLYADSDRHPADLGNTKLGKRLPLIQTRDGGDLYISQLQKYADSLYATPTNTYRYFYMYGSNSLGFNIPVSNVTPGQSFVDIRAKHGVYSFIVGGEVYAIDNAFNFKKVKKRYQTEMMAVRAMEEGNEHRELWNQFDLTIEMMGNTIFAPGMHIHSSLNTMGTFYTNADPYLASHLGLEGYYLITNVNNSLKGRKWITTITAKWQSHSGIGKSSSQPYKPQ